MLLPGVRTSHVSSQNTAHLGRFKVKLHLTGKSHLTLKCTSMLAPIKVAARGTTCSMNGIPGVSSSAMASQVAVSAAPSGIPGRPLLDPVTQAVDQALIPYTPEDSCQQSSHSLNTNWLKRLR